MSSAARLSSFVLPLCLLAQPLTIMAQDSEPDATALEAATENADEIISYGTKLINRHEGMDAFLNGDFVTAEIEFEREFLSLKRTDSNRRSAIDNAALGVDRAIDQSAALSTESTAANGRGGGSFDTGGSNQSGLSSISPNVRGKRAEGTSLLLDGELTYQDFAFARYMSAMSEIKLGKLEEARDSLKQSIRYDGNNYDARMRLGLLDLNDGDFDGAAEQLQELDKMRRKCRKKSCERLPYITEATVNLAKHVTAKAAKG